MPSPAPHRIRCRTFAFALLCTLVCTSTCLSLSACYGPNPYATPQNSGETLADRVASGTSLRAERGSKTLDIKRMKPQGTRPSGIEKNSWTVFVYICGSNLESEGAAATSDLNEMIRASGSGNVRFVVETGGAKSWRNRTVSSKRLGRYVISRGRMAEADNTKATSMGDASTLADFLTWGVAAYPAERMGLILWNHGGGSISGVCFDEQYRNDSLFLRELDDGLAQAYTQMWDKFEFVGFDACLMSTLETANVLATYARYMISSQESEPATGWEYASIVDYLAAHPGCDGLELGRAVCDAYLASTSASSRPYTTLSVVDLSCIDQLLQDFYRFSQEMYAAGDEQGTLAAMSRGIQKAPSYGSNNRREGYTNMVDLAGLVNACAEVTPSAAETLSTLHDAVPYQVRGNYHADACGLSTYYPLRVSSSQELTLFQTVAVNPSYLDYVDRLAHGSAYDGGSSYTGYSGGSFYEDNIWSWLLGNAYEAQQQAEDNWQYVDDHTAGGSGGSSGSASGTGAASAEQFSFSDAPQVDDEGTYWFCFDENGLANAAVVSGLVYERSEDGADLIALGETYDVWANWETGEFADGFDGRWLSLPDGQNLNLTVESYTEQNVTYACPVKLNGKPCYLRVVQNLKNGRCKVAGVWGAVGDGGALDRGLTELVAGDVIVPCYDATAADDPVAQSSYEGEEYTVDKRGVSVTYGALPDGAYEYRFCIQDAYGDTFLTDAAHFEVDPDGSLYFV